MDIQVKADLQTNELHLRFDQKVDFHVGFNESLLSFEILPKEAIRQNLHQSLPFLLNLKRNSFV